MQSSVDGLDASKIYSMVHCIWVVGNTTQCSLRDAEEGRLGQQVSLPRAQRMKILAASIHKSVLFLSAPWSSFLIVPIPIMTRRAYREAQHGRTHGAAVGLKLLI
ncbi:hypothetical protein HYQ45_017075 [Verticillium longisporum]|uniref:Uncharacterized protein n=1 Tax=Verticillium longisporum TaxID=100787 RepID=A0A8I2Z5F1_VERLO|nr:hypothetical protein HYQ44_016090 [Verticillium longisporum]KAG7112787.1 hypothetical protein HYQ45_017075 [Verticillium longisporum]KAG7151933.1 hypothetical protein HYQ46_012243 [Verticillium longisporum]